MPTAEPKPYQMSLEEHLGDFYALNRKPSSELLFSATRNLISQVKAVESLEQRTWHIHPYRENMEFKLLGGPHACAIRDADSKKMIAGWGIVQVPGFDLLVSIPLVFKGGPGSDLGSELMYLTSDFLNLPKHGVHWPGSFEDMVEAHRLHIERALIRGDQISDDAWDGYVVKNGNVVREHPMTAEIHNKWVNQNPKVRLPSHVFASEDSDPYEGLFRMIQEKQEAAMLRKQKAAEPESPTP